MGRRRASVPPKAPAALAGAVLAAVLAAAAPAAADDVFLTNGNVFTGVLARVEGDRVTIRLSSGAIRLPRSRVARIERKDSALAAYLARKEALSADPAAGAEGWVELARWARGRGLDSGLREAARTAAVLDPDAPGLAPLMAQLGYLRDGAAGPWMLPEELAERRGLERWNGSWLPHEQVRQLAELARAEAETRRRAARDAALADLAAAVRAEAEAARARAETAPTAAGPFVTGGFVTALPGWWTVTVPPPAPAPGPADGGGGPDAGRGGPPPRHAPGGSHRGGFQAVDAVPGRLHPEAAPPPGKLRSGTR